jgi:hypothetical protein
VSGEAKPLKRPRGSGQEKTKAIRKQKNKEDIEESKPRKINAKLTKKNKSASDGTKLSDCSTFHNPTVTLVKKLFL